MNRFQKNQNNLVTRISVDFGVGLIGNIYDCRTQERGQQSVVVSLRIRVSWNSINTKRNSK